MSGLIFVQNKLKSLGLYKGSVDGKWGPLSEGAFMELVKGFDPSKAIEISSKLNTVSEDKQTEAITKLQSGNLDIAWSAKVSPEFVASVKWIAEELKFPDPIEGASWLMACMAFETGMTFSPSIKNMAGSSGRGLIQFMSFTAKNLGTTTEALEKMTDIEQLNYVYKYFKPYTGKLKNVGDVYMTILWPKGVGKSDDYVLWGKAEAPTAYRQNLGLDINKDQVVTRGECLKKIKAMLELGCRVENRRVL